MNAQRRDRVGGIERDFPVEGQRRPALLQADSGLVPCFWCEHLHPAPHALSVCPACTAGCATMRSLGMRGSYPLSDAAIDEALTRTAPGAYALGYLEDESFRVFFVGRADADLRERLHAWVDMPSRPGRYASAAKAPWGVHRRGAFPVRAPAFGAVASAESSYTRFAFRYDPSAEAAFQSECRLYDAFAGLGDLDNDAPPAPDAHTAGPRTDAC